MRTTGLGTRVLLVLLAAVAYTVISLLVGRLIFPTSITYHSSSNFFTAMMESMTLPDTNETVKIDNTTTTTTMIMMMMNATLAGASATLSPTLSPTSLALPVTWQDPKAPFPPEDYLRQNPGDILTTEIVFCSACEKATGCREEILKRAHYNLSWSVIMRAQLDTSTSSEIAGCADCSPHVCRPMAATPLRLDEAAPRFVKRTTFELTTIPMHLQRNSHLYMYTDGKPAWYVYNPAIIALPESMKSENEPSAVYLAIHRVSVVANSSMNWIMGPEYTAFTILSEKGDILRELLVDCSNQITQKRTHTVDLRVFSYNGTLFMTSQLFFIPFVVDMDGGPHHHNVMEVISGDTSRLAIRNAIIQNDTVARMRFIKNQDGGSVKNSQFFTVRDNAADGSFTEENLYIELWPIREIARVVSATNASFLESTAYSMVLPPKQFTGSVPAPAYDVMVPLRGKFGRDRGSACCVKIERQYYADLVLADSPISTLPFVYMGMSHLKSRKRIPPNFYAYISRMYAVVPYDGVKVVATSGCFCLSADKIERYFQLENVVYNCPAVHFIMSMAENPVDSSKVVVGYGADDSLSTMMEITKRELALHLFSPIPNTEHG